jgi:hypothetical protein
MPFSSPQACVDCGRDDPALLYRSGRMQRCHDCQNFANLLSKKTGGGVEFERDAFLVEGERGQSQVWLLRNR